MFRLIESATYLSLCIQYIQILLLIDLVEVYDIGIWWSVMTSLILSITCSCSPRNAENKNVCQWGPCPHLVYLVSCFNHSFHHVKLYKCPFSKLWLVSMSVSVVLPLPFTHSLSSDSCWYL